MPRRVDHEQRRRELADAVCRVVAREGVEGASLRLVAEESGWSIGSMRHYFATKSELLLFAIAHAGDRIEERIGRLGAEGAPLERLREVVAELLPLDGARREEALVWLAFLTHAAVEPGLAPAAEGVWRQLHDPFVQRIAAGVRDGELPAQLDAEAEGARLHALVDGLAVHLVTAPRRLSSADALTIVDHHLATLRRR